MNRFSVRKLHFLSAEGLMMPREVELTQQPDNVFQAWIDLSEKVCERKNLLSFANHFLYIGEKT